jgi:sec-independent protein translocase protein TatC
MLALALPTVVLFEVAELIAYVHDRRKANRPDPYAGLSDDEASPLDLRDGELEDGELEDGERV